MQPDPKTRNAPTGQGRGVNAQHDFHVQDATAEPLLQRLDGVQKSGAGWRARCPACGGTSRKLSVALSDNRVLLNCFGCGDAQAVLDAVGLRWADLHPPRTWPPPPDEQRRLRRAIREVGWSAALAVLPLEAAVVRLAAIQLESCERLAREDYERLALACCRIDKAAHLLTEQDSWKPDYCYPPIRLADIKHKAAAELRRQLEVAEREADAADIALAEFKREQAEKQAAA